MKPGVSSRPRAARNLISTLFPLQNWPAGGQPFMTAAIIGPSVGVQLLILQKLALLLSPGFI